MKKVVVAMSGGVDSSVAAWLLKQKGYDVIGMMLRLWSENSNSPNKCCNQGAVIDARRVAAKLQIPFYYLDIRDVFKKTIVDNFLHSYSQGLTPNPCFICNKKIRFGILLNTALELGAQYLATGHYALIQHDKYYQLLTAKDKKKDQSYMLYRLSQSQLKHALFPIGNYLKDEVKQIAIKEGLQRQNKKESQDLCFLGNDGHSGFMKRHLGSSLKPGPIVNLQGKVLGEHQGLACYTIGQRKKLYLKDSQPNYVVKIDVENNKLVVAHDEERGSKKFTCSNFHFIGPSPRLPYQCQIKIRYNTPAVEAIIENIHDQKVIIQLAKPIKSITPGQGAVVYDGKLVVGGGTIDKDSK